MTNPTTPISDELYTYMLAIGVRETPILRALREESLKLPNACWTGTPERGALLQLLARLTRARRILEIGTFTGYSTLALALVLPEDGKIVTCDIAGGWSEMGTHYWRDAGVEKLIDRRIGSGEDVIAELSASDGRGGFDMVFLDADMKNYPAYLDPAALLLRPGGIFVIDNVFRHGRVIDESDQDHELAAIREFNLRLWSDRRFEIATLPVADGMTLALRV